MKNDTPTDKLERAIVFATGDDWDGVYVEGLLVEQGHSISVKRALEIGATHGGLDVIQRDVNTAWLEHFSELPVAVRDVVWGDEYFDPLLAEEV